jgi:hypothetical protein
MDTQARIQKPWLGKMASKMFCSMVCPHSWLAQLSYILFENLLLAKPHNYVLANRNWFSFPLSSLPTLNQNKQLRWIRLSSGYHRVPAGAVMGYLCQLPTFTNAFIYFKWNTLWSLFLTSLGSSPPLYVKKNHLLILQNTIVWGEGCVAKLFLLRNVVSTINSVFSSLLSFFLSAWHMRLRYSDGFRWARAEGPVCLDPVARIPSDTSEILLFKLHQF